MRAVRARGRHRRGCALRGVCTEGAVHEVTGRVCILCVAGALQWCLARDPGLWQDPAPHPGGDPTAAPPPPHTCVHHASAPHPQESGMGDTEGWAFGLGLERTVALPLRAVGNPRRVRVDNVVFAGPRPADRRGVPCGGVRGRRAAIGIARRSAHGSACALERPGLERRGRTGRAPLALFGRLLSSGPK